MSVRLAMFVAVSIAIGAVAAAPEAVGAAAGLDYEFFKTKVQPIFLKKRENHARCIQCHTEANNFVHLERLAPNQTMWNEEQSKKNYEWVSKAVSPANRAHPPMLGPVDIVALSVAAPVAMAGAAVGGRGGGNDRAAIDGGNVGA